MATINSFWKEKAKALSGGMVIVLTAHLSLASLGLCAATLAVLVKAGYWWLAILIALPLGFGFDRLCTGFYCYCRPNSSGPKPE